MKLTQTLLYLIVAAVFCVTSGCSSQSKNAKTEPAPPSVESSDTAASPDEEDDASSQLSTEEEALFDDEFDMMDEEEEFALVADPFEPFNRAMFYFNDKLYVYALRPIALGYRTITPEKARTGVDNFFTNLTAPIRFVNCVLQGKDKAASVEFGKFVINSTWGVLGIFDLFKDDPELNPDSEDFGQTLAAYGFGDGFYIVWPILGSSTLRDSVGSAGDTFLNPITYVTPTEASMGLTAADTINTVSFRIEDIDSGRKAAFDLYEASRNYYIQNRRAKIKK